MWYLASLKNTGQGEWISLKALLRKHCENPKEALTRFFSCASVLSLWQSSFFPITKYSICRSLYGINDVYWSYLTNFNALGRNTGCSPMLAYSLAHFFWSLCVSLSPVTPFSHFSPIVSDAVRTEVRKHPHSSENKSLSITNNIIFCCELVDISFLWLKCITSKLSLAVFLSLRCRD